MKIIILGAGGDGKVIASTLRFNEQIKTQELHGFLDDMIPKNSLILDKPVLGKIYDWRNFQAEFKFVSALHKVKQMPYRVKKISSLMLAKENWTNIIDNSARIDMTVKMGVDIYIGPNVVIQPGVTIGDHVSIRAGANIGHDAYIHDFSYIGPNAVLCGNATMELGSHLGPNACIVDNQSVGKFSIVGACSVVTKRLPAYSVYLGVPAQKITSLPSHE